MNIKKKKPQTPSRLFLREWAALDDLRKSIEARAEEGNWLAVPKLIQQAIDLCLDNLDYDNLPWFETAEIYGKCLQANLPRKKFPVLETKEKTKSLPWEYEGRGWYFWANLFASRYGWGEDQIEKLDPDDAIGLYQEVLIDEQLESEWWWGLSEIAYPYDKAMKRSRFKPLDRPDWMRQTMSKLKSKPIETSPMPAALFPVGVVINLDEL